MKHFSSANMLDRAILAISPAAGADRIAARARANLLMNYDAASNSPRLSSLKGPATDADTASRAGRARIRNRSRDLVRNAPFAARAQSVVTNAIVGTGIAPAITKGSKAAKKAAGDVILPHLASTDLDVLGVSNLASMQRIVSNGVFESGEVLAVRRMRDVSAPGLLPFQVEILEIDYLDVIIQSFGGNEVIDGIEYDADGKPVFYHIYDQHPGAGTWFKKVKSRRIPASDVLHIRRIDRAGQRRGVPWLAPVMVTLGEMRDYQDAQIVKQKISAMLVAVVQHNEDTKPADGAAQIDQMAPGAVVHAYEGEEVSFSDPPQVNDYDPVMRLGLQAVAMGIGVTAESISGDLSRVNFSSMRAGRIEMNTNIAVWQEHILIAQFCDGVARWALDAFRLTGQGRARMSVALEWTAPKPPLVDPIKEIPAIAKKIEAGLSSRQREIRSLGVDPDTIARERAEDAKADAAAVAVAPPSLDAENDAKEAV